MVTGRQRGGFILTRNPKSDWDVVARSGEHTPPACRFRRRAENLVPQTLPGAGLKTVASAILADVESGFQPGGENVAGAKSPVKLDRFRQAGDFSGRQDAALHGRPGGPPLLFNPNS